ncbi:hypothetical protein HMPREF1982_03207 [Clostridiales bacterium oral taxon 876 str. F0540]|nr:hypothetical protein HMPREF1982_03207 [Clostridiales bacterium oral taxon 876 str. F0540]
MQSSYNVIKNNTVKPTGLREIVTNIDIEKAVDPEIEKNTKPYIENYENLAKNILENARRQSEQIKLKAFDEIRILEQEALDKAEQLKKEAFEKGFTEGQQEGFNKAYYETIDSAKQEAEYIISNAHEVLNNAKTEYENYLSEKTREIGELVLSISRNVIKREIEDKGMINEMILNALETSKNSKNFIIRCNSLHIDELKSQVDNWKEQLGFFGDIFILKDNSLEPGNAVIDKGNGRIVVGIDYALLRIKDILEGKE